MPSVSFERGYSVKSEGDGIFIDPSPDTPTAGKVIVRKFYHKTGFISDADVIGDYTLIHTFADNTAYADTVATFDGFEDGATYGVPPFTLAQTWEEVTAAPAFTGLLNETYGSGAEAAYSTRRLNGNVTDCMVIRRASDSTTTTIGFVDGDIDEAAIETFCTGTTCTVYQWLDQSGNGNTATAAASGNEPTIYTGGALVKQDGRVALDFDGTDDYIKTSDYIVELSQNAASVFAVSQSDALSANQYLLSEGDSSDPYSSQFILGGGGTLNENILWVNATEFGTMQTGKRLSGFDYNQTTFQAYLDGNTSGSAAAATVNTETSLYSYIGTRADGTTAFFNGKLQELITYKTNKSSVRTDIEENIGDYFTQNTPLLDTYSGAAAAYSLRRLSSSYVGSAVEVYNGSSYADIGFDVFGELNTVALAAHCGSNDGFIRTWYDQGTNGNDATQSTTANMPKIYDGTTGVITENGKPAVEFDGSNDFLQDAVSIVSDYPFSLIDVATPDTLHQGTVSGIVSTASSTIMFANVYNSSDNNENQIWTRNLTLFRDGPVMSVGQQDLNFLYWSSDTVSAIHVNGSTAYSPVGTTDFPTVNNLSIGSLRDGTPGQYFDGKIQEVVWYASDQSANRAGIESNIATFYDITI